MTDHIKERDMIIKRLKEELMGPAPIGEEIDTTETIHFPEVGQSFGPWVQKDSKEEILTRDSPIVRYGVGVLYPMGTPEDAALEVEDEDTPAREEAIDDNGNVKDTINKDIKKLQDNASRDSDISYDDDFEIFSTNQYRPSSMAVSFLAEVPEGSKLMVEAKGGRYEKKSITVADQDRIWWLRSPIQLNTEFPAEAIRTVTRVGESFSFDGLNLRIEIFSRPYDGNERLITVCLVNQSSLDGKETDERALFQSHFKVSIQSEEGSAHILPYPGPPMEKLDKEEQALGLLYRKTLTFAIGHGCAADWGEPSRDMKNEWVSAESLPVVQTPSVTPEIRCEDGSILEVSMAELAGLVPGSDGFASLLQVIQLYEDWISEKRQEIDELPQKFKTIAKHNLDECWDSARRMRDGLEFLQENPLAMRAFQLANHAILLQQIRSGGGPRKAKFDEKNIRYEFTPEYSEADPLEPGTGRGKWRPFQIAFILMTVRSCFQGEPLDDRTVELIWFPTGGGKTEAYLGLAAFKIFSRRLKDPKDTGVDVLMRYTLRLLTTQQFQRATMLICAMEYLRRRNEDALGQTQFSIGIWLGSSTTPNYRESAVAAFNRLVQKKPQSNPFLLGRCPWCGAQMGKYPGRLPKKLSIPSILGYAQKGDTVAFNCPDALCEFSHGLPIYVIDEDIYQVRPSLVIGTVDKFAMLAWRPEARALFGIGMDGERETSPPGLIIQDELHLISGPLGSMVGLYETVIHELCTDRRGDVPVPPKIVCSTATIRRYEEQIKALYAVDKVKLFPSPGMDIGDSFFSHYAYDDNGQPLPGRIYVGVHAPGLGSLETAQVRTFAALLQAPMELDDTAKDPWWTLMVFFNTLRELGTTLSLFQSRVPDYFRVIRARMGTPWKDLRKLNHIMELTSRLLDYEVPRAIDKLEVSTTRSKNESVDICLASNIIEVGIDIDRLSLMAIVGQPKTTSQYIQVTGRVGRRWWERPGLVVTLYSPKRPRDRSHFEKFRNHHEQLYSQVEPTSVTPFSSPTLERALHAVMVIYALQMGGEDIIRSPYPYPEDLIQGFREVFMSRAADVDPDELQHIEAIWDKRASQWEGWERIIWTQDRQNPEEIPLLRRAGAYATQEEMALSWETPMSMRTVDVECRGRITNSILRSKTEE